MVIDTHTHLSLLAKNEQEIRNILQKCKEHKIGLLFNISVDFESNFNNVQLSEKYNEIYFTVGIHPAEADKITENELKKIENLILHKKCIGIGETGIDLYRNYSSAKNQIRLFEYHLQLAQRYNKPIIIHSRDSFKEIIDILSSEQYRGIKGVFHCFSYGTEEAKKCIDLGYKISFAGNLTYKSAKNLQEVARKIGIQYILIETDAPYLAPVPYRGETNYPYYIIYTIKFLSELRQIPISKIEKEIEKNIKEIFHI